MNNIIDVINNVIDDISSMDIDELKELLLLNSNGLVQSVADPFNTIVSCVFAESKKYELIDSDRLSVSDLGLIISSLENNVFVADRITAANDEIYSYMLAA